MNIMDNYGEFELPEEKARIEVIEDPVKVISSTYDIFKKLTEEITSEDEWYLYGGRPEDLEKLYDIAIKLFDGKEKLKPKENELEEIIKQLKTTAFNYDGTGLFLSAMQNALDIKVLAVDKFFNLDLAGYKLSKDKILLLGGRIACEVAGMDCDGVIINNGDSEYLGYKCRHGLYINNGNAKNIGTERGWGIHINRNNAEHMGGFWNKHYHKIIINKNKQYVGDLNDELLIKLDNLISSKKKYACHNHKYNYMQADEHRLSALKKSIDQKLQQIVFLKDNHKLPYKEQIRQLKAFNFKQFQIDIISIARTVNQEYRRIKK